MLIRFSNFFKNSSFSNHFCFNTEALNQQKRAKQDRIVLKLQKLNPSYLQVTDTTLGANSCGSMFKILVESPLFEGKNIVEQHQMVTEAIGSQLQKIHGFNLKTKVTPKNGSISNSDHITVDL